MWQDCIDGCQRGTGLAAACSFQRGAAAVPGRAALRSAAAAAAAAQEEDYNEQARQRAQQLAQAHPMRDAFAGVMPVAHVRLEAAGGLRWAVRCLACPAGTSIGELRQVGS